MLPRKTSSHFFGSKAGFLPFARIQTNFGFSTLQDNARGAQGGVERSSHGGEESVAIRQTD